MTDDQSTSNESRISRRNVLRTAVASAAVAGGFAAPSAGRGDRAPVEPQYVDDRAALDAIDAHGGDVLDLLADRGLVDAPTAAALAGGTATTEPAVGPADDARYEVETDRGRLSVTVRPETGEQYAILAPEGDDSDEVQVLDPNADAGEVEPQCPYIEGCIDKDDDCLSVGSCPQYYIACCSTCYTDGTTGSSCAYCGDCEPSCAYHCN